LKDQTDHTVTPPLDEGLKERLRASFQAAIAQALKHLPTQRPMDFFVLQNTLYSFEHLPFTEGVEAAAALFKAEPWLSEEAYRRSFKEARILERDLKAVIAEQVPDAPSGVPGVDLREATLRLCRSLPAPDAGPTLRWRIEEGEALKEWLSPLPRSAREALRDEGLAHEALPRLWSYAQEAARRRVSASPSSLSAPLGRWRDLTLDVHQRDTDDLVVPLMIRWCIAYIDPAYAQWPMPHREEGLLKAALRLWNAPLPDPRGWLAPLRARVPVVLSQSAEETAVEALARMGVKPDEVERLIQALALSLPGWAGMIALLAERPDLAPGPLAPMSLVDFFALRLLLEELATRAVWGLEPSAPLPPLRRALTEAEALLEASRREEERAWSLFNMAQIMGVGPSRFPELCGSLHDLIERDNEVFRRRLWHLAFERRYRVEALDAFLARQRAPLPPPQAPWLQVITCIDDREESIRRHLEEQDLGVQTFGFAGFFGVAMFYQPLGAPRARPLCPAPVTPQHWVREVPLDESEAQWRKDQSRRARVGAALIQYAHHSQGLIGGAASALLGVAALGPMVYRLINPRRSGQQLRLSTPKVQTRLALERPEGEGELPRERWPNGTLAAARLYQGYTVEEMTRVVAGSLNDMGLRGPFAPLVFVMGHSASSANNPYDSDYQCGACGGGQGGPNARAFAQMANDPRVRAGLLAFGIEIPAETTFIGGMQDTSDDHIDFYDHERIAAQVEERLGAAGRGRFMERLHQMVGVIERARLENAYERARRFALAPRDLTPEKALRHVEGRARDLAEPRPEYKHATNALHVICPRHRSRGLFLDRRSFLTSYHSDLDPGGDALERHFRAGVMVAAGINLQYLFSYIDNHRYGAGSKLPQNIAALVGVMDGHQSDLRTGLVWQMVEIHEPMRMLNIIEGRRAVVLDALRRVPAAWQLAKNGWMQLAVYDPDTASIFTLSGEEFIPHLPEREALPRHLSSRACFEGREDNVPFALIELGARPQEAHADTQEAHA
jgi:uncharacterized protein YbcC (UPF0753/DUF2309 family)